MSTIVSAIIGTAEEPRKPEPPPNITIGDGENKKTFLLAATGLDPDSTAYRAYRYLATSEMWEMHFSDRYPGAIYRRKKSRSEDDLRFARLYSQAVLYVREFAN